MQNSQVQKKYLIHQDGVLNRRRLFQEDSFKIQDFQQISSGQIEEEDFVFNTKSNFANMNASQYQNQEQKEDESSNTIDQTLSNLKQRKIIDHYSVQSKHSIENINDEPMQQYIHQIRLNERRQSKQLTIQIDKKDTFLTIQQMKQVKKSKLMQIIKSDIEEQAELQKDINEEEDKEIQKEEQQDQEIKIITFFYIYKFIKSFLLKYIYCNSSLLQAFQIKIINDKSSMIDEYQPNKLDRNINHTKQNNIFDLIKQLRLKRDENKRQYQLILKKQNRILNIILNKINFYIHSIQIISPNVFQLMVWDIIALLAYLFLIIVYPFILSFDITEEQLVIVDYIQIFYMSMIFFDSILGFHIGIYEFGEIVKNRKKVYKKYYQDRLFFDLISICSLLIGAFTQKYICCLLSIAFRYSSIVDKVSRINMNLQIQSKLKAYYDLLKLVFYIIILIHIFGCGFYFVGVYSCKSSDDINWIKDQNLAQSSKIEQYINSIYFITITMVTIGYGDIHPINQYEKLFTIIVAFITCGFFAFSLNLIGEIAQNIQKKSIQLQQKQQIIQAYLNSRQIENVSQMRVLKYLEFLNGSQEETNLEGQKILYTCSKSIREDILREYYGKILSKCQLFKDNFSQELTNRLSLKMKEKSFAPGETIIEKGSYLQELYFIKSGKTEYFFKTQHENIYISDNENQIIDFKIFISQSESDIQIRSQGITTVIYIEYNQFIETFEHLKNDKEKLCQIKDQVIYGQSYKYPCQSCGQYKHTLFNCPQLTYQLNKSSFLKKFNHNEFQQRDEYFDRSKQPSKNKKFKTFQQNHQIKLDLKLIRCDLVNYFYNLKQDTISSQQLLMKIQNDKEFYITLPKIYHFWFNSKEENENGNKDNLQDKYIYNSQFGAYYEELNNQYTTSSFSSSASDYSGTLKQLTQISKTNQEKTPSISKQESIQASVILGNENQKSIPHSKADLEAETHSFHQVPSDNKIAMNNQNKNYTNCSMIEENLSPSSQKQITIDIQNEQNGVDYFKQQSQNKVKFNISRRETPNKTKKTPTLVVNTQPEQRQQSMNSLNTKNYKEPSSPVDEHYKDNIINVNVAGVQNASSIQLPQQKGLHRVSMVQYQLQEQINMLQDILKFQQRTSSKTYTQNNSTLNKLKSIKYQQDLKGFYINPSSQQNINLNNKNQNQRHKNMSCQDIAIFFEQNGIFGKCGKEFETVKEFEFYYPKFNFAQVIKSYKKFQSFQKRQKNQQEEQSLLKSVKKHTSMKQKNKFFEK
ncbi:hypothetical protein ABPG72_022860 [Tetrahymena utriculariae]